MTDHRSRRRALGVPLLVTALIGLGTASAAQLDVGGSSLAAGAAEVGDCQAGAPLRVQLLSVWSGTQFVTTGVRVHGVEQACTGDELRVTLVRTGGAAPVEVTLPEVTAPGTQADLPLPGGSVSTSSIAEAKVVIHS